MRIRTTDCCSTQKGSGFAMTQEQSKLNECRTLIFCVQDFLARHSLSPESGKDLQMPELYSNYRIHCQTSDLRVVPENVPGLLSHDKGRTFHTILSTLSELGYGVEWKVLNSKDFGVPQSRKRVYLVGYLDGGCCRNYLCQQQMNISSNPNRQPRGKNYSPEGLSCTLTSLAGGMGWKNWIV